MLVGYVFNRLWTEQNVNCIQMLDLETVPRMAKMPMDFATYLLSSSPPATNLELLSLAFDPEAAREWAQSRANNQQNNNEQNNECQFNGCDENRNFVSRRKAIKPIIIKKDDTQNECDDMSEASCDSGRVTPTSPCSPRTSKKVSFADHRGLALVTVRIMTEPSDHPPKLAAEVMKSITNGEKAVVSGLPPYKLKFTQPASDYMAFRDKIEKNCISLENVILRDYTVLGTIKVKNICFDKRVFVRCTFDSWNSSQDFEAKFVQPFGGNLVHNFDTFSFEFEIDSHCDTQNKVQFAVCFETPSGQHWDNNSGVNYEILPTDFSSADEYTTESLPTSTLSTRTKVDSWSEYSCWRHVDTSSPYY
ncbi:protein phosphatase 1 regulatory subunit 3B-like isoform X2 [Ruditapes philippinarum]|uniref:protein phosphatase 1 regulatory subunit 3B-like isoform X2 n=1 Tax=Ruditapes philippinarum TaxID=129788 RepID=UPI00295C0620|nr:protein phosphatase 1 regulatory subunit 3B-like isoform X2 [Ruditapes philippinarum]